MVVGVLKEQSGESRVAITPELIRKNPSFASFLIEAGAGELAGYSDDDFSDSGASTEKKRKHVIENANIIFSIRLPDDTTIRAIKPSTVLVGQFNPLKNIEHLKSLARVGVSTFSLDLLPRTTRAQPMDVLSSQGNLAGYQAAVYAISSLGRAFPMMMTAAGSVPPARVLVIGAGVAGLQAIATARRMGAIVSAFDVRAAAKESVESLGATFVDVQHNEAGDGAGGYAKEMSVDYRRAQEAKLLEVISRQDVVITTAQIPNKPAPKIITAEMVSKMKRGALIVDLAGESGGNCELTKFGECVSYDDKRVVAPANILNDIAYTASLLFASNLISFAKTLLRFENGMFSFDIEDQLVQNTLVTHAGTVHRVSD
ncbi:MAG: NAD(P) transhydrogenase subunit alpha [Holosporales bacterium]|jgi:NAD(P) transhydrogenase subunit alpha|nr:NAD(P) transhydrogenase subunit alpha [Holosporales bacterium]